MWFSEGFVDALKAYTWPGNVRHLAKVIEEAVDMASLVGQVKSCWRVICETLYGLRLVICSADGESNARV